MLNYFDLSQMLNHAGAEASAAECHGFLCGQVCVSAMPDQDLWMEFLDLQTGDTDLEFQCHEEIRVLIQDIEAQLRSLEFEFEVMLPGDDSDLNERVEALGDWCHGFLNGFGLGDDGTQPPVSEDGRELLKDITMICRVGLENPDEEDERALAEIVEYIRSGVMMLFEETRSDLFSEHAGELLH